MAYAYTHFAHHAHTVDVRELPLQLAQLIPFFLGAFSLRHVEMRADHFNRFSGRLQDAMADPMNVFYPSVRQYDSVLDGVLSAVVRNPVKALPDLITVVGMDAFKDHLASRGPRLRIEAPNSKVFLRPVEDLAKASICGPTTRTSQALGFHQISFASLQLLFRQFALNGNPC